MGSFRNSPATGISLDDASQTQSGGSYSSTSNTLNMSANATLSSAGASGIRFRGIVLNPNETIRSARLTMRYTGSGQGGSATNGANFNIYGHKVANSPAFLSGTTQGANDVKTRLTALTSASTPVQFSSIPNASIQYSYDVRDIIQEIVGPPGGATTGWASGNALTFILKGSLLSTFVTKIFGWDTTTTNSSGTTVPNNAVYPELYVDFGVTDPTAFDFDLVSAGDSHAECAVNAGGIATNAPILVWPSQVIGETAIGLTGVIGAGSTTGFFGVNADYHRGYTANGILQDSLLAKYGNSKLVIYQSEYAIGGTKNVDWAAGTTKVGSGYWDAPNGSQPSLNTRIANPRSPSKRVIMWWSNIGNDIFSFVSGGATTRIVPRGSFWGSTDWSDAGDATKFRNQQVSYLETNFKHAFDVADAAGTDLRIVCPGYHNFQVMGNNPNPYLYVPSAVGQNLERSVWSTQSFGFYSQIDYDLISASIRSGQDRYNQSTFVKFAAQSQIDSTGVWDTNNSFTWGAAQLAVSVNPLAGTYYVHNITGGGYSGSTDGWKDGMRNVTDVTVNQYMVGETHAIYQRVIDLHPEWQDRLFFLPHPQAINTVLGSDTARSADHTSVYAQPLWQGDSSLASTTYSYADGTTHALHVAGQFEGIHMCADYFRIWVDVVVNELDTKVDFLPGYIPPTETAITTISRIDPVTKAVIASPVDPSAFTKGWWYQIDYKVTAITSNTPNLTVDVTTLTAGLDGSATMQIMASNSSVIIAERAINQGDGIALGRGLVANDYLNIRVRGTCV